MKLYILFLLFVNFACAVCRDIGREDNSFWSSLFFESVAEGPFAISGLDPDGKYIVLENISEEREYLDGWTLKQEVDGHSGEQYTFKYCSIAPWNKRKIVANRWKDETETGFVATSVDQWGTGNEVKTYLYNGNGTLKAEYTVSSSSSTTV